MRKAPSPSDTAKRVRHELVERNMQHKDLAVLIDIEPAYLSKRLQGRTQFQVAELVKIAEVLGIPEDELLTGAAGRAAGKRGPHSVSPPQPSERGSRERLDGPATDRAGGKS